MTIEMTDTINDLKATMSMRGSQFPHPSCQPIANLERTIRAIDPKARRIRLPMGHVAWLYHPEDCEGLIVEDLHYRSTVEASIGAVGALAPASFWLEGDLEALKQSKEARRLDRKIRRAGKNLAGASAGLFTAMESALHDGLEGDPKEPTDRGHHRRIRALAQSVVYRAKGVTKRSLELEELQRYRDGRPTIEEEDKAGAARLEANLDAEAARERREWAADEMNARHDSVRERFSACE